VKNNQMKLAYLIILFVISTACSAVEMRTSKVLSHASVPSQIDSTSHFVDDFIKNAMPSQLLQSTPNSFKSFDILDSSTASTLIIGARSFSDVDAYNYFNRVSDNTAAVNSQYFTEFQLTLKNHLTITGQWTRLHDSYIDGYDTNRLLRPVEWSLVTESRSSTAREVGLNWTIFEGLQAFAKLQTVNSSAWIPQVSIPRFITQDSEHWTLAAVELVYSF
jgi:hypothetical protein